MKGFFTMRHKIWQATTLALLIGLSVPALADGLANMERLIGNKTDSPARVHKPAGQKGAAATQKSLDPDAIRLTPDRTKILRLKKDAASVVVTNPAHASVVLDSARTVILMPRTPGTTSLIILDRHGEVILERNVIVSAAQPKYVRIRRICDGSDRSCQQAAYYYCPDGCYEINTVEGAPLPNNIPTFAGGAPAPETRGDDDVIADEIERDMTPAEVEFVEDPSVPQMDVPQMPRQRQQGTPTHPVPADMLQTPDRAAPVNIPPPPPQPLEKMEGEE